MATTGRSGCGRKDVRSGLRLAAAGGHPWFAALLAVGFVLVAATGADAQKMQPGQEGTLKGKHGDWELLCIPPPPGSKLEHCAAVQRVKAADRSDVELNVYFQRFANGVRVLRVFVPLNVILPKGLGIRIDDRDVGTAPFLRCFPVGCYSQVVAEDDLVEKLKSGKTAIFSFFQTEEAGIGIPISLAGFGEALAKLK